MFQYFVNKNMNWQNRWKEFFGLAFELRNELIFN